MQTTEYPVHTLSPDASELWKVCNPPPRLFAQGSPRALTLLEHLPSRALAVVGTRNPTARSLHLVRKTLLELSQQRLIIVSGFARGIDTAAHQTALDAQLPTIAVLGTGIDIDYPPQNRDLRARILASDGLLITEHPPGTTPLPSFFPNRNRLIAGWSTATWVAEAGHRSGALNTAAWARRHRRVSLVTPCHPGDPSFAGNQRLLMQKKAEPFWGVETLEALWLELISRPARPRTRKPSSSLGSALAPALAADEIALTHYAGLLTEQQGGATVQELLDWAISQSWSPQKFFNALQKSLQMHLLLDENGLLLKNLRLSD